MATAKNAAPHIRIFPHNREEFPSSSLLTAWLLTALKANGGQYALIGNAVAELPTGSVVLFRHGDVVVGEGVVRDYTREAGTGQTFLTGEERQYEGRVSFVPGSIRMFVPPVPVEVLQRLIGDSPGIMVPRGYPIISDWRVYPKLLEAVGKEGHFM